MAEESAGDGEADSLATDLFRYGLRERWTDRVRFLVHRITTPSRPEDWTAVSVGSFVIPLHAFSRPAQVVRSLIPALLRRRM
jgi:hypothetical protein